MALASPEVLRGIVETQRKIEERFPGFAFLLDEPDVRNILIQAANEGRSPTVVQARLSDTEWWKTRSNSEREWDLLTNVNPGEADSQIEARFSELKSEQSRIGLFITDADLRRLAETSLRDGWTPDQVRKAMVSRIDDDPQGRVGAGFRSHHRQQVHG